MEERLDRMEGMLTQLIKVVAETNKAVLNMKKENEDMFLSLRKEISDMKDDNEKKHLEIMNRFSDIELDQDIIWDKTSEHERKLSKIMKYKS